jgi:hypothetical protein
MGAYIDITGQSYGRLRVVEQWTEVVGTCRGRNGSLRPAHASMVRCWCSCGGEVTTRAAYIRNGDTASCGCAKREQMAERNRTHDGTGTPLYRTFRAMVTRCENSNADKWDRYGGRGIKVCAEWRNDFDAFRTWAMANGYQPGLSVDRINPDGDYEPGNCQWITVSENSLRRWSAVSTTHQHGGN